MKLARLNEFDGPRRVLGPLVAQSARALIDSLVEDFTPSEGIYYCVRNPDGWSPFSYRFDEYPEIDHFEFWEEYVSPVLAARWARVLKQHPAGLQLKLSNLVYGFPRGRVSQFNHKFKVLHGNDMPGSVSRNSINRLFSLPSSVSWESDDHERCQIADRDGLRRLLKLAETWKAT